MQYVKLGVVALIVGGVAVIVYKFVQPKIGG